MTIKIGNSEVENIAIIEPYSYPFPQGQADRPDWVRPSEWLDMPVISSGDDKVALLLYIQSGVPYTASIELRGTAINPSYVTPTYSTIDWGDGNISIHSGNSPQPGVDYVGWIHHDYNFDDLPEESQYSVGGDIRRQALIEIDNSVSGCFHLNLSSLKPSPINQNNNNYANQGRSNLLDVHIASQNLDTFYFGSSNANVERIIIQTPEQYTSSTAYYTFDGLAELQHIEIPSGFFANTKWLPGLFGNNKKLKNLPYMDFSSATGIEGMFNGCQSIKSVPNYNFSNVTNAGNLFNSCSSLTEIPDLDYSNMQQAQGLFAYTSIKSIPSGLDLSSATRVDSMFNTCRELEYIPKNFWNQFSNVDRSDWMFYNCQKLKSTPIIDMPNCRTTYNMFNSCSIRNAIVKNLQSVVDYSYGMQEMFRSCKSLENVTFENPDDINCKWFQSMFNNTAIKEVPKFNTSSGLYFNGMFGGCPAIQEIKDFDLSSAVSINNMCSSMPNLRFVSFKNVSSSLTDSRNAFYNCTNLETFPSGLFESADSCPELVSHMFYNCRRVENIPDVNLSRITDGEIFYTFASASSVGEIVFGSGSSARNLFSGCSSISHVGYADGSLVNNFSSAFQGCRNLQWCDVSGISVSVGFLYGFLSSGAIENVFNNLASGVTSQTIDIRQNYGTSQLHPDTIAIATSKGWTVTT